MIAQPIVKVTPDRRTFIVYRAHIPQVVCPAIGHQRDFSTMTASDLTGLSNTVVREMAGLELALDDKEYGTSTVTGDTGYVGGTVPAGYHQRNVNRSYPEVTGSGSGSSLALASGPVHERQQAAGDSLDNAVFRNDADQTAFPGPGVAEDGIIMDRVFTATAESDLANTEYVWLIEAQVHNRVGTIPLIRAYFTGPASFVQNEWRGYGQYCVTGFSDGSCRIYERGLDLQDEEEKWRKWQSFDATQPAEAGARSVRWAMRIRTPNISVVPGVIRIKWGSLNEKRPTAGGGMAVLRQMSEPMAALRLFEGHLFRPKRIGSEQPPTRKAPLRADVPRPFKNNLAVRKASWATSGYARDRRFHFAYPHWSNRIRVEAFGHIPEGTDALIKLFKNDGTEITTASSGTIGANGRFAEFEPGEESTFYPEFHLSGDGTKTPVIRIAKVWRDGTLADREEDYPGEEAIKPLTKAGSQVSIITGGADPLLDSFSWSHVDIDSSLGSVLTAGIFPFRIETEYPGFDPEAENSRRCVLGGGFCEKKPRKRRRKRGKAGITSTGPEHPHPISYEVDFTGGPITFMGSVRRTLIPDFGVDASGPGAGQPRKASEALRHLLNLAGWPLEMIDIPGSEVRLFPADAQSYELDFNSDFMEVAVDIAKSYFGAALHFDWNAGEHGVWKLLGVPSAPYANVAHFTTELQPENKPFTLAAYPALSGAPNCPILELTIQDMRPQANFVEVIGGADDNGQVVRQAWHNTESYAVHPDQTVNPEVMEHPDWVGFQIPLWKRNTTIQNSGMANWMCARLAQQLGHAYKLIHVEAPLLLITHEDDPDRRRPLRFGDPVTVKDGEDTYQCIVRSVAISYERDSCQLAVYELETARDA